MIELILLLFLAYFILLISFQKDYTILSIDGFFIMMLGVYCIMNVNKDYFLYFTLGIINIAIGLYVIIRSQIEIATPSDSDEKLDFKLLLKKLFKRRKK